jgi:uncharacterized cupredoxin-like copper-binding protein
MPRSIARIAGLALFALVGAACTQAGTSASASGGTTGATVNVTLQEFAVVPDPTSAAAGDVTFHVTNDGPDDVHEFVIIRTDLAPDALPTGEDGSVEEEGEGMEVVDEIEDIPVGESQDLTVPLDAGNYVLICNIVESGEVHYTLGMRTAFTVE